MPDQEKRATLLRQWEMLRLLPKAPAQITARQLKDKLEWAGFAVNERTVQRDLKALAEVFPLDQQDRSIPYGWRWSRDSRFDIPALPLAEALALELVAQNLQPLLPRPQINALQGLFDSAQKSLAASAPARALCDWLGRVRVIPTSLGFLPPKVDPDIQDVLYEALFRQRQVSVAYENVAGTVTKELVLNLLGLVQRGPQIVLIATAWDYQDIRQFALHRFRSATMLASDAIEPAGFDLDDYLASGAMDILAGDEPIVLKMRLSARQARYLGEAAMAEDQVIVADDDCPGAFLLTATVNDTNQLRWWLRAHANEAEVIEPATLRDEIGDFLGRAAAKYCKQPATPAG